MTNKEKIDVINFIKRKETISEHELQVKFIKGYNWSGRILDYLEEKQIISPFLGTVNRSVICSLVEAELLIKKIKESSKCVYCNNLTHEENNAYCDGCLLTIE